MMLELFSVVPKTIGISSFRLLCNGPAILDNDNDNAC